MIISTVLTEKPIITGDTVTLPIVRAGTRAKGEDGKIYHIVQDAINSSAESYTGGIVTINHKVKEQGTVVKSWQEGDFIMATVSGLSPACVDAINSPAYRGVSQESTNGMTDSAGNIIQLKGTGVSFIFYPFKEEHLGCPLEMGCGIPTTSCGCDAQDFNFPLYTDNQNSTEDTPGGVTITEDATALKSTISALDVEKTELKSTIDELRQELKDKDAKLESTVQAAVKAALESHDKTIKEQAEQEAALTELKSCMSDGTVTEFLKAEPSVAVIKSTIAALKAEAGKHVGAAAGKKLESTAPEEMKIGNWNAMTQKYE